FGQVLGQSGGHVSCQLSAAAFHVDIRGIAALESCIELGEHVLVLHGVDFNVHPFMGGFKVGGDLLVIGLAISVVGVVPPGDGGLSIGRLLAFTSACASGATGG